MIRELTFLAQQNFRKIALPFLIERYERSPYPKAMNVIRKTTTTTTAMLYPWLSKYTDTIK